MPIRNLNYILEKAEKASIKTIAVASANEPGVLEALKLAEEKGFVKSILIGNKDDILTLCDSINYIIDTSNIIHEPDIEKIPDLSVELVKSGTAQILMKGLISTSKLLKAVIKKDKGLLKGEILNHAALIETPYYQKILCVTDAAMNIAPDLRDKIRIIENTVKFYQKLGVKHPKIAMLAAIETVNPKMQATLDAASVVKYFSEQNIQEFYIEGPLAFDNAISKEAATIKGIKGIVAGDADILVVPEINSGNILYKSLNFMGGASTAGTLLGASAPIILTSRADSLDTKLYSIALAVAIS